MNVIIEIAYQQRKAVYTKAYTPTPAAHSTLPSLLCAHILFRHWLNRKYLGRRVCCAFAHSDQNIFWPCLHYFAYVVIYLSRPLVWTPPQRRRLYNMVDQHRIRSACESLQSDQNLYWSVTRCMNFTYSISVGLGQKTRMHSLIRVDIVYIS